MAEIQGIARDQIMMFPPTFDELVGPEHPGRLVDAFVAGLDLENLGAKLNNQAGGAPNYERGAMTKMLLYGYLVGERSSRRIERMTLENVAVMWLMRGVKPSYRTIARYRKDNKKLIKQLLKETITISEEVGQKWTGTIYADGSKIRANASRESWVTEDKIKKYEEMAERMLREAEEQDKKDDENYEEESGNELPAGALMAVKDKVAKLTEKIAEMKEGLMRHGGSYSRTDSEAKMMKEAAGGKRCCLNGQLSVSEAGIIMDGDVTGDETDNHQLNERIAGTEENTGKKVGLAVADSGYYETDEVREALAGEREVVVKKSDDAGRARGKKKLLLSGDEFEYDQENDEVICPRGKRLARKGKNKSRGKEYKVYIADRKDCEICDLRERCCPKSKMKKGGRVVHRLADEEYIKWYEKMSKSEQTKEYLKKRMWLVEGIIGVIKQVMGFRNFLLRGKDGARSEWKLVSTAYNIVKVARNVGQGKFIAWCQGRKHVANQVTI